MRSLRIIALAMALSATPACAVLKPQTEIAAAQSVDQRAYLLIGAYALALETATPILRDPATPRAVKAALGKAEAAATPAVELVKIAAIAHARAGDGAAAIALSRAITEAEAPVAALANLVKR